VIDRSNGTISGFFSSEEYGEHKILSAGDPFNSSIPPVQGHTMLDPIQGTIFIEVAQFSTSPDKPFTAWGPAAGSNVPLGNRVEG